MARAEDASAAVAGNEVLYRRLADSGDNFVTRDVVTGAIRPSSGAFKPDADGVSVYRRAILAGRGLGAGDCVTGDTNVIVGFEAGDVRTVQVAPNGPAPLDVVEDAWPVDVIDPEHPRNAAHALIVGWGGLSKKEQHRAQRALAKLDSLFWAHPEDMS